MGSPKASTGTTKVKAAAPLRAPSTLMAPSAKPRNIAPVSPMMIRAGIEIVGQEPRRGASQSDGHQRRLPAAQRGRDRKERHRGDGRYTGGQPVQAVDEVDHVGQRHQPDEGERDSPPADVDGLAGERVGDEFDSHAAGDGGGGRRRLACQLHVPLQVDGVVHQSHQQDEAAGQRQPGQLGSNPRAASTVTQKAAKSARPRLGGEAAGGSAARMGVRRTPTAPPPGGPAGSGPRRRRRPRARHGENSRSDGHVPPSAPRSRSGRCATACRRGGRPRRPSRE